MQRTQIGFLSLLLVTLALVGCDPTKFTKIADGAPVRVIEAPGSARVNGTGFGSQMATYSSVQGGVLVSRLAGSGGGGTQVSVFPIFDGTSVGESALFDYCLSEADCGVGIGASVAGVAALADRKLCAVSGAPAAGQIVYRCESGADSSRGLRLPLGGLPGTGMGTAMVAVPDGTTIHSGSENVRVVISAPTAAAGQSSLYYLRDSAASTSLFPVPPTFTLPTGVAGLGDHLAIAPIDDARTLLVATANAGGTKSAVVLVMNNADASLEVRACLDGGTVARTVVAAGDLNGDGLPEIAVAEDGNSPLRTPTVNVFDGRGLPETAAPSGTCPPWNTVSTSGAQRSTITCEESSGISCTGNVFGYAMHIADVNADGFGELMIGAPFAAVGDTGSAGVVYVYPGGVGGAGALPPAVLKSSDPSANGNLGRAITTFQSSPGRWEIVAAETGSSPAHLFVFLCSGLNGDAASSVAPQCLLTSATPMVDAGPSRTDASVGDSGS